MVGKRSKLVGLRAAAPEATQEEKLLEARLEKTAIHEARPELAARGNVPTGASGLDREKAAIE